MVEHGSVYSPGFDPQRRKRIMTNRTGMQVKVGKMFAMHV